MSDSLKVNPPGSASLTSSTPASIAGTAAVGVATTAARADHVHDLGTALAVPPAIGGTTPAAGAFTTLSASSTLDVTGVSTLRAGEKLLGSTPSAAADQVSRGVADISGATTAAEETKYEGGGTWQRRQCSAAATLKTMQYAETVADDGTIALPVPTNLGRARVSSYDEEVVVTVKSDGTCTKMSGTTNTDKDDTDTKLCVFSNTGVPTVKNRLGGSRFLLITYELA